ncbi:MAG: GAF domain-containing protein [Candidatus Methanofastidiosia archaeon]
MMEQAIMEEDDYQDRIKGMIKQIIQAAFKSKQLDIFLDEIVKIGAEKTEAKSCVIFLLEEPRNGKKGNLCIYAASGKVGKTLETKKAWYYVPERELFTGENTGRKKTSDYLKKYKDATQKTESRNQRKSANEESEQKEKSLMDIIAERNDNIESLVENRELPMGITASIVKNEESMGPLNGEEVRKHPEWRGSYEGDHEICTSLVEVPLKTEKKIVGMIKIENHRKSDPVSEYEKIEESTIYCFTEKHKEILTILADSAIIAIENILYKSETYKKIFGTEILRKIDDLEIDEQRTSDNRINKAIHDRLSDFCNFLKIDIEDISGIDEIYGKVTKLMSDIACLLDLNAVLDIIDNIGPAFESLLGTDIRYRDHFIHEFQVFLLGYYLINEMDTLRENLITYLQDINPQYSLKEVLKIWFLTSIFHDFSYSVCKIEVWLMNYFSRVAIPSKFQVNWADIFAYFEAEKTNLAKLISSKSARSEEKVSVILRDVFLNDHDHGLISGLALMSILNEKIQKDLLGEACCAITLHTENVYSRIGKLTMDQFPFGFLLVLCDNAQQWGRPRTIALIPDIEIKLEDVIIDNCTPVKIRLRYRKLTQEQKRIIGVNTSPPTKYWFSEEQFRFSIELYEGLEKEPFRSYIFPSLQEDEKSYASQR